MQVNECRGPVGGDERAARASGESLEEEGVGSEGVGRHGGKINERGRPGTLF